MILVILMALSKLIVGIEYVFCSQRNPVKTLEKYYSPPAPSRLCMTNTPFVNPTSLRIIRAATIEVAPKSIKEQI